ncbi:MAG: DUF2334 domain-containing protein [Halobacteriota archaeon]
MKKCLALLLIVIMACSVFSVAGVVTAPKANAASEGKKHIVFRDDDAGLQVGGSSNELNVLKAINQVHTNKNVPVSLGIVPHPSPGTGNQLLTGPMSSYLKSLAANPLFELAQHGYTHWDYTTSSAGVSLVGKEPGAPPNAIAGEGPYAGHSTSNGVAGASQPGYSEFRGRSYADQYNAIKQGRDDIKQAFGVTPTTFIPPWNTGDDNTLKAAAALGFKLYSTADEDFNVHQASLDGITVQGASWYIGWNTLDEWKTTLPQVTQDMDAKLNSAAPGEHFVVFYHYWHFEKSDGSLDSARITLFSQYLDHLKSRGDVDFTTLGSQQLGNPTSVTITNPTGTQASGSTYWLVGYLSDSSGAGVPNKPVDLYVWSSDTSYRYWTTLITDAYGWWWISDHHRSGAYYEVKFPGDGSYEASSKEYWVPIG